MRFSVVFEAGREAAFPDGYYYAHVPSLGLTTHGPGVEGARQAATDLLRLWLAGKRANGEEIAECPDTLFGTLEIPEDA
jgi:predicted RNase H-like HicB family nuclease